MSKLRLNRRTFMKVAGLAAGSAAVASPWKNANAQGVPPRILFLYAGGGWTPRAMFMRPSFAPAAWGHWSDIFRYANGQGGSTTTPDNTEFEFDFLDQNLDRGQMSRVLDPFWNMRSKMLMIEGLAMLSNGFDTNGDDHARNHLASMSGIPSASQYDGIRSHASGPSLDQRVLSFLRESDPLAISFDFNPSIYRDSGTNGIHYFLYRGNGMGGADRVPTEGVPNAVFSRLFGGIDPSEPNPDEERRAMAERAVFARLQQQYGDMAARMRGADRMRLESHRDLLSELDQRLGRPRVACSSPDVTSAQGLGRAEAYEADWNSFADMIVAGFGCGLTRVASLSLNEIPPEAYGLPADVSIHHEYEHPSDPLYFYGPAGEGGGDARAEEGMIQRNIYQARLVERLINRLDQVPDMDGTLLDNTIVVYVSELGNGNHSPEYCPFLVFGGGNTGALRPGRYLKYPQNNPNPWHRNFLNEYTGTPHSRLYVALLQAMGMDIDFLHAPSIDGSVPGLGIRTSINMSGPLERLS